MRGAQDTEGTGQMQEPAATVEEGGDHGAVGGAASLGQSAEPKGRAMPLHATACRDEAAAISAFCRCVAAFDPEVTRLFAACIRQEAF